MSDLQWLVALVPHEREEEAREDGETQRALKSTSRVRGTNPATFGDGPRTARSPRSTRGRGGGTGG